MRSSLIIIAVFLSVVLQTANAAHIATWTTNIDNAGRVAIDATHVLMTEPRSGRIVRIESMNFEANESLAMIIGTRGDRFDEFKYPRVIAVDGAIDRMYIADKDNFRMQVFTRAGIFLSTFGYSIKYLPGGISEGWMPRTSGLAVNAVGRLFVATNNVSRIELSDGQAVVRIKPDGVFYRGTNVNTHDDFFLRLMTGL